ncbi:hypothetical protein ACB092_05G001600 [Castanea dentata]
MPIQDSLPEVEIVTSKTTKRGGNFSINEDNLLVSAWLNISMDAVHGTDQKQETFWQKVWQYFCENDIYGTTRSTSSLSSQWGTINRETSKFAGLMAKVEAQNQSGATNQMKLDEAKALYKASSAQKNAVFLFEHCWVVLKNRPNSIDQVGSNDDDTMVLERPIGRKAEKAKRKRKDGDNEFREYLAKKLHYIQESHEQDIEALRIKAERVRVDAQRADMEKEMLRLETIKEEERIMAKETSGMFGKERLYFENLKD